MDLTVVGCSDAFSSGGRRHSCYALRWDSECWLLDCGASAFMGLRLLDIDPADICTVVISHAHGDHFGGLPFLFLDALFVSERTAPLTIIGPRGIRQRFFDLMAATYAGYAERPLRFALDFREMAAGETLRHRGVDITAFAMIHDAKAGPCLGLRLATGSRVIAYSGDTSWTEELLPLGRDADLFICECCNLTGRSPVHLSYEVLKPRLADIGAKHVLLTHFSPAMLAARAKIDEECAEDGLTISLT